MKGVGIGSPRSITRFSFCCWGLSRWIRKLALVARNAPVRSPPTSAKQRRVAKIASSLVAWLVAVRLRPRAVPIAVITDHDGVGGTNAYGFTGLLPVPMYIPPPMTVGTDPSADVGADPAAEIGLPLHIAFGTCTLRWTCH